MFVHSVRKLRSNKKKRARERETERGWGGGKFASVSLV